MQDKEDLSRQERLSLVEEHQKSGLTQANCFTIWYRRLEKGRSVFQRNLEGKSL